jgi:hypothetical protein
MDREQAMKKYDQLEVKEKLNSNNTTISKVNDNQNNSKKMNSNKKNKKNDNQNTINEVEVIKDDGFEIIAEKKNEF